MRIVKKASEDILFSELKMGDVFEYDNSIYMKTEKVTNNAVYCKAVCLESGEMKRIFDDELVIKINGKFIEE